MKILVTGAAGFIGFHVCLSLIKKGFDVVGLDNINEYYSVDLKYARLSELGIEGSNTKAYNTLTESSIHGSQFRFVKMNLEDREELPKLFEKENFTVVCSLAAQAGVRYSLENPEAYVDSNIVGFLNILECCRHNHIEHLIYASSSSVYGLNDSIPFSVDQQADRPVSLYAATKKSNELMAHAYSNLYGLKTTGLRFFTVYGPWGRPDMAIYLFTDAIYNNRPIKVFNEGEMERDFTYIDDIVNGILAIIEGHGKKINTESLYQVYNIGAGNPVKLMDFITEIGKALQKEPKIEFMPMQKGDVEKTWADIGQIKSKYGYHPNTTISEGIPRFVDWYKNYVLIEN
ncbi:NAD-dependent epimerase/dehydratase family protein [Flagellimonas crocea]|uniref:NAD-dependent epimerase/dehydratase family protein n=1 Tax=Flagellimonas crocea TaxID=3067311 RepID=UPI00296E74DC|nr:NAD-dependent epimerase/dehydratase family protein [Muricauda sp. DH64]